MAPGKKSQKGWHRAGAYSSKSGADRKAKALKTRNKNTKIKITERDGKVRTTPKGKRVIHPADYPGGKKTRIYRVYAK